MTSASSFYGGIYAGTDSLVLRNQVTNAHIGIFCHGVASVISNTVKIFTGQTGVNVLNAATTLLDQNTVIGPNTDTSHHYTAIDLVATRNNNY